MFWVIRGTDPKTNEDFALVVEGNSRAAAETWALKRNIPYVVVEEAVDQDVATAREAHRLWRHTPESRYTCFGRPVAQSQLTCLMICGVATILVLLRNAHLSIG